MTPLALTADALAALAVAAAAATFLVVRTVRFFRAGARGACACPATSSCGKGGPSVDDLRAAAARGAARVNRGGTSVAR